MARGGVRPAISRHLQKPADPLDIAPRACRPTCRRAFARFSKSKVVRNLFLLNILRGFLKGTGNGRDFEDARPVQDCRRRDSSRLNPQSLHRRVRPIFGPEQSGPGAVRTVGPGAALPHQGQGISVVPVPARRVIKDGRSQPAVHDGRSCCRQTGESSQWTERKKRRW